MNENLTARLLLGIMGGVVVAYLLNWLEYTIFGQMTSIPMLYDWGDRNQLFLALFLALFPAIMGGLFTSVMTRSFQFSFIGGVLYVIVGYVILWGSAYVSGESIMRLLSNSRMYEIMAQVLVAIPLFMIGGAIYVYVWPKFLSLSESAK